MDDENKRAVDEVIENLDRIPKEINSKVFIKDILRELDEQLKSDMRRRVSYK